METARQFVSVFAVLGLLLVAAWWARKRPAVAGRIRFGAGRSAHLVRVVERVALTPQHSLHVVELNGETLLLGAGPSGVQVIRTLGETADRRKGLP